MQEDVDARTQQLIELCGEPEVGDYAAIGNGRTLALVSRQGSVDWLCAPHFSAPSLFAAIVSVTNGGRFHVGACGTRETRRCYIDETNVLQTEHRCDGGRLRVTDFMALPGPDAVLDPEHQLIRKLECLAGEVEVEVLFQPRPDYARCRPQICRQGRLGWFFEGHDALLGHLQTDLELQCNPASDTLYARHQLQAGEGAMLSFGIETAEAAVLCTPKHADRLLDSTIRRWQRYSRRCHYQGPFRAQVLRSQLALQLLDSSLTGAMIAAGTTSLPESFDGDRNWDYRYCWLRDAGQVLRALVGLGYGEEAGAFLGWMLHATRLTRPELKPLYDIFGRTDIGEQELPHLDGHRGHGPVRVGNAAREQLQLDVHGEVVSAALAYVQAGHRLDRGDRHLLAGLGRYVCRNWRRPDHGIWEPRKPARHNTHSKMMCWSALDGLLQIDARQSLAIERDAVAAEREAIRADIEANGFDSKRGCYRARYDGDEADATLLLMASTGYLSGDDPRLEATRQFVQAELGRGSMLYRYPPGGDYDGLPGHEHPFGICSFWMVECLARQGRVAEATRRFEDLLGLANDVGLYAEELHRDHGRPVGNYPQAFTHVGLINAALALQQAEEKA